MTRLMRGGQIIKSPSTGSYEATIADGGITPLLPSPSSSP